MLAQAKTTFNKNNLGFIASTATHIYAIAPIKNGMNPYPEIVLLLATKKAPSTPPIQPTHSILLFIVFYFSGNYISFASFSSAIISLGVYLSRSLFLIQVIRAEISGVITESAAIFLSSIPSAFASQSI
jgi:hypothetical protein